jgi:hypothetical protein
MSRVKFDAEPAPLSVELEWVAPDIIDLQRDFHRQDVSSMPWPSRLPARC